MARSVGPSSSILLSNEGSIISLSNDIFLGIFINKLEKKAFEIPLALQKVATSGKYDAIVALGAVIRGGTPHFEYVAGECVKGISQASLDSEVPIAFGVLTVDTVEQAIDRAGDNSVNKGAEAAESVIRMINLLEQL